MNDVFLICPVRHSSPDEMERISAWVTSMEETGHRVHWPARDTRQDDPIGVRICMDNADAIRLADTVFVWYSPTSQGSLFDLGVAFGQKKTILLANRRETEAHRTDGKSFVNVLLHIDDNSGRY